MCGAIVLAAGLIAVGCAGGNGQGVNPGRDEGARSSGGGAGTVIDASDSRAVAYVNGRAVTWSELRPALLEAAGATVLEEAALDAILEREASRRGVRIEAEDLDRERRLLLVSLRESADEGEGSDIEQQLLAELRRARGLGDVRFNALLRRTALLRRLVQDDVQITDEMVRQAHAIAHGPRHRVRLITTSSEADAASALRRLREGEAFGDVAARLSTDISAARGGMIEPLSVRDPSYPAALREMIAGLGTGEVGGPVALDTGFALALLEEVIPGDGIALEQARPRMMREARLRQERMLMSRLAQRLLSSAQVRIVEPGLREAWRERRER